MTATLDLDLRQLLCRYVVDPATGALRVVDLDRRRRPGLRRPRRRTRRRRPGRRRPPGSGTTTAQPFGLPTLPGLDGRRARPATPARPPGCPGCRRSGGDPVITRKVRSSSSPSRPWRCSGCPTSSFSYVGLDRLLLGDGVDVAADFSDSGGIFVNAEVTYRGVGVGRVSDMQLTDDGVRVTLTIDPDATRLPADTTAVVANRSAVGEQYVDLRPDGDQGPYLTDGSVIPQSRTAIPIPVEQLLLDVDDLVGSIDTDDLRVVVDELGTAFAGAGDDLARLLDNGDLLLARAEQSLPQTLQLITDGPDRAGHPGGRPLGDPVLGQRPAGAVGHPGQQRPGHPLAAGQRAGRRGRAADAGAGRRARAWARWCATSTCSTT